MTRSKLHFEEQEIQPDKKRVQDELESFQLINLPTPTYGNPDPMITHIGAPLPPGTVGGFSINSKSDANEKQPAIQFE